METKKLCAILISLAGCASYPQPNENLATSVGAVRGAQEAGAEQLPDAALHLRLAQEQNDKARELMSEGDNERAAYMTERARSDAELALALAHEERAKKRAQQASASLTPSTGSGASPAAPTGPATQPSPQPSTSPSTSPADPGTVPANPAPSTP
jgi:hypothetical protein